MQTNFNDLEIGLIITGIILFLVGILLWRLFVRSKNRNQELSEELTLLGAAKALDEKEINKLTNLMDAHVKDTKRKRSGRTKDSYKRT
jgi:hypothetical protein